MPRQSPIVKLRNKLSHLLFENKEKMEENTYKILYETLRDETVDASEEKHWVKLTYAKAVCRFTEEEVIPALHICQRNILLTSAKIDTIKQQMNGRESKWCTFHNVCNSHNYQDGDHKMLARELDEEELWECTQAQFKIIRIEVIE